MKVLTSRHGTVRRRRAKVRVPPPPGGVVGRPSLHRWLARIATTPVTVVVGPQGCGKTVALSSYARSSHASVHWLSLDVDDDEPSRFWPALSIALRGDATGWDDAQ